MVNSLKDLVRASTLYNPPTASQHLSPLHHARQAKTDCLSVFYFRPSCELFFASTPYTASKCRLPSFLLLSAFLRPVPHQLHQSQIPHIINTPFAIPKPRRRVDLICVVEGRNSRVWWHTLQDKYHTERENAIS